MTASRARVFASAVLFDVDDTLVDFTDATTRALLAQCKSLTGTAPPEAETVWRELERRWFPAYLRGEITFTEQRRRRAAEFAHRLKLPALETDRAADAWMHAYLARCDREFRCYPDVVACLDELDAVGVAVGALSNSQHAYQDRKLRLTGVRDRFAALVCCDDVDGAAKPDPRIFLAGCEALGAVPADCIYVGDNPDTDVRAANLAGLHGVLLDRTGTFELTGLPVISDLRQLTNIVHIEWRLQ